MDYGRDTAVTGSAFTAGARACRIRVQNASLTNLSSIITESDSFTVFGSIAT
jgi:hypothetical protein